MMDRLDHLLDAAGPLLRRIDEVLSEVGAPEGHAVWVEVRRVRLLPGDAARAVGGLCPEAIRDAVPELRVEARAYADLADALPFAGAWSGEAAEAYEQARRRAAEHLNGGPDSLSRRMTATADLADTLTGWMAHARSDLATVLAEVLLSAEAVALRTADPPLDEQARAAADLAVPILRSVADSYDRGETLLDETSRLA